MIIVLATHKKILRDRYTFITDNHNDYKKIENRHGHALKKLTICFLGDRVTKTNAISLDTISPKNSLILVTSSDKTKNLPDYLTRTQVN